MNRMWSYLPVIKAHHIKPTTSPTRYLEILVDDASDITFYVGLYTYSDTEEEEEEEREEEDEEEREEE